MKKIGRYVVCSLACAVGLILSPGWVKASLTYPLVDTGQTTCYDDGQRIACPQPHDPFFGQDGQYQGLQPSYKDNNDGTISDTNTGLMWSKSVDGIKLSLREAQQKAQQLTLGGHRDWRVPTIKELYSLIDFRGTTGTPPQPGHLSQIPSDAIPFINTDYFDFRFGNREAGERFIDAQWLSSTEYVGLTMDHMQTLFGVNFADGRIKGYGYQRQGLPRPIKKFYVRYVRGKNYGENNFKANGDGTITDRATGLIWMQMDSARAMNWEEALKYASSMHYNGYADWRLPNAKELQSIVDYTRSPDTTDSAAIDPLFQSTPIINEAGIKDYGFYWTSTTHLEGPSPLFAVYVAFGRAIGSMQGRILDVHGAGSQRSDPKTGQTQLGMGPQGDARRVRNLVRLVRGGDTIAQTQAPHQETKRYPYMVHVRKNFSAEATNERRQSLRKRPRPQGTGPDTMPLNRNLQPPKRDNDGGPGFRHPPMPAQGTAPVGRPNGADWVRRLDQNGDGKISAKEFDGPPRHFGEFDRDKDGFISVSEAPTGPPPGMRRE